MFLHKKWFILYISLVTELVKHEVFWIFKQTLQRLFLHLFEPIIRSLRDNFPHIKYQLSLYDGI